MRSLGKHYGTHHVLFRRLYGHRYDDKPYNQISLVPSFTGLNLRQCASTVKELMRVHEVGPRSLVIGYAIKLIK